MFYYLEGVLHLPDPYTVVLDCGGVGYKLAVSSNTAGKLSGKEGQVVRLYTVMEVKEGAVDLFGFFTEDEQAMFHRLTAVSGVGPKAALSILSVLSPERLRDAVSAGDAKAIMQANGVGRKIAERILLELKDKLGPLPEGEGESVYSGGEGEGDVASDALSALLLLGYSRTEAYDAIRRVDPAGKSLDEIVRLSLKQLMKG